MKNAPLIRKTWRKYKKPVIIGLCIMGAGLLASPIGWAGILAIIVSVTSGVVISLEPTSFVKRLATRVSPEHVYFFSYLMGITFLIFQSFEYPALLALIGIAHIPFLVSVVKNNKAQKKLQVAKAREKAEKQTIAEVSVEVIKSEPNLLDQPISTPTDPGGNE